MIENTVAMRSWIYFMIPAATHMENMKLPYLGASSTAINVLICFHRQLSNEEDPPEGPPQVAADAPPPYSSLTVDSDGETPPHPHVLFCFRGASY